MSGLDTSALHGFEKIKQRASESGLRVLLSHVPARIQEQFRLENLIDDQGIVGEFFDDIDHALEWSESHILEAAGMEPRPDEHPLDLQLEEMFDTDEEKERFKGFLERREIAASDYLFHEHERSTAIYFVESGELSVLVGKDDGGSYRLRRLGAGALVGVGAFFRRDGDEEVVSVLADSPSVVHALSRPAVEKMAKEEPHLLLELQSYALHFLSDRLAANLDLLRGLLKVEE